MKTLNEIVVLDLLPNFIKYLLQNTEYNIKFKNYLQSNYPDIYADIESLTFNKNCSCFSKVHSYIKEKEKNVSETVNSFFKNNDLNIETALENYKQSLPVDLSGKILKTSNSKWGEFVKDIKKHDFRSFSIYKEGDEIYVYFI
jgi:hypothetical protein